MEKRKILQYLFLSAVVIALSVILPFLIRQAGERIAFKIRDISVAEETEEQAEEAALTSRVSVGDPSKYEEDRNKTTSPEKEEKDRKKYQDMVDSYHAYVMDFTREVTCSTQVTEKEVKSFIRRDAGGFYEACAAYAYARWGIDKKIERIRFDSILSYRDDEKREVDQAMIEFLHTSHPDTENQSPVICIYYKADGYYYFP